MTETINYAPAKRSRAPLYALAIAALLLAAGLYVYTQQSGSAPLAATTARIAALEKKTEELSRQVQVFSSRPAAPVPSEVPGADNAEATARIAALEEKVTDLLTGTANAPEAPDTGAIQGTVTELDNRLHTLEQKQYTSDSRTKGLVTRLNSFYRLNDAVRSGAPYTDELAQLRQQVSGKDAVLALLDKLKPFARTGVPGAWKIKQGFSEAVRGALAPKAQPGAGFGDKLMANLEGMVTVRRVGAPEGDPAPKATIARAEAHMDKMELKEAVEEISTLGEPYKAAFAKWLEEASFALGASETLLAVQTNMVEETYDITEPAPVATPTPALAPSPSPAAAVQPAPESPAVP